MNLRMNLYIGQCERYMRDKTVVRFLENAPSLLKGGILHYMGCIATAATKVCQVKVDDGGTGVRHTIYPMTLEGELAIDGLMVSTCGPAMAACLIADGEAVLLQIELNETTDLISEQLQDVEGKERLEITQCRKIIELSESVGKALREDRVTAVELGLSNPEGHDD